MWILTPLGPRMTRVRHRGATFDFGRRPRPASVGWRRGPLALRPHHALGILTYHPLCPEPQSGPAPSWNVRPERLERQLSGLLRLGFRAIPLGAALRYAALGRKPPARAFVVTFDDGYSNYRSHALPVLDRLRIPSTVFLATAYLDQDGPFPFDAWAIEYAARERPAAECHRPLARAECRALSANGNVEIGCHTHTHRVFRGRADLFREDMARSISLLESEFGVRRAPFSFPFGICDEPMMAAARTCGVSCALTTRERLNASNDPFGWGRFGVIDGDSPSALAGKLGGWYTTVRDWCDRRIVDPARAQELPTALGVTDVRGLEETAAIHRSMKTPC